jgi:hypothetical protein
MTMAAPVFVLVHSPLVGPSTWGLVVDRLRSRDVGTAVPSLRDRGEAGGAFWQQHAMAAAAMLAALPRGRPLVLVAHSGAGPLLPAIRQAAERDVAAYLFVDAGIPEDGASRLDLLRSEIPDVADQLWGHLESGGRYPEWLDDDLVDVIPDAEWRGRVLAELQPRALPFWTEPLPVFSGWPDAPCAYLQLSQGYAVPAERARREGWLCRQLDAGHFHMLVDPEAVVGAMMDLVRSAGIPMAQERSRA